MKIDVTDATLEQEVVERSNQTPVVVDLWAPWCGPCKTLGPIIERVVDETDGKVVLAKINTDENPQAAAAFRVQGIPAVYALKDGKVVDGFVGAHPEPTVREFVEKLVPTEEDEQVTALLEAGDEASLRQALELEPDDERVVAALAELLIENDGTDEALELLGRLPESPQTRHLAALARTGDEVDDVGAELDRLLDEVAADEEARQRFLDLLEVLGPDDPRTGEYRKALTAKLY